MSQSGSGESQAVEFFPGFKPFKVKTSGGVTINGITGGSGPPVLLIHGAPCNLVNWRKVAPALAEKYTVVATDLRGYGDSDMPDGGENHENYSKRAMAQDQVDVMTHLGFDHFLRTMRREGSAHAQCEDYRAASTIDLEHDKADLDKKLTCPLLVLWGDENPLNKGVDIVSIWKERANDVRGHGTPSAHWLPEQIPEQVVEEVTAFIDENS